MNRKITFPQLVTALTEATGSDQETASEFLKAIFESISTALGKGETVTVKGLGTFTPGRNEIISWIPDKQLAASVNEPFEFFEAVELGDGVTEEILTSDTAGEEIATEEKSPEIPPIPESAKSEEDGSSLPDDIPPVPSIETADTAEPSTEPDAGHSLASATQQHDKSQPHETAHENQITEEEPSSIEERAEKTHSLDDEDYEKPHHKCKIHPCIAFVSGLLIGLAAGYFGAMHAFDNGSNAIEGAAETEDSNTYPAEPAIETDTLIIETEIADTAGTREETAQSPYLAIDTVTPNRYLTTMSRQYYGDYRFWVYIYEENKDKITNPNRISPGTTVIIPHPEKYGIDSNDRKSLAKAERKSGEIQSKNSK